MLDAGRSSCPSQPPRPRRTAGGLPVETSYPAAFMADMCRGVQRPCCIDCVRAAASASAGAGGRMHAIRPPADNRLGDRPGSKTCRIPGSLIEACPSARPARTSSTAMQSPDDRQAPPAQRRVSRIAPGRRQRARIGLAVQSWDNEPARHVSKRARSRPARAALARLCARSPSEDTASCDPGSVRAPAQAP